MRDFCNMIKTLTLSQRNFNLSYADCSDWNDSLHVACASLIWSHIWNNISFFLFISYYFRNLNDDTGHISSTGHPIDPRAVKFHAVKNGIFFSWISSQNYIKVTNCALQGWDYYEQNAKIETMNNPTDIGSDNNGHIFVSGQGSNSIHRLTQNGKVLDIPLDSRHSFTQPVALCFYQNYDKLYISNGGGTSILILNVIW